MAYQSSHQASHQARIALDSNFHTIVGPLACLKPACFTPGASLRCYKQADVCRSAQVRSVGSVPFSALIACMIVAMTAVYVTQQGVGSKRKKGRSTERLD